jgi:hypothetical protein
MNPTKLTPIVSKETREAEYIIPGFGEFPPWAGPAAGSPMPFPGQFLQALFRPPEFPAKSIPEPFTESWHKRWLAISSTTVSDHSRNKCAEFFGGTGLSALKDLANRGCNPNLVMSLFTRYLWDELVPSQERTDPDVNWHLDALKAVQTTRKLFRNQVWKKTPETELVEKALEGLEAIEQSYVNERDFSTGSGTQNDKKNRVIYAIHAHLTQEKSRNHQWRLLLNLFQAADAVSVSVRTNPKRDDNPPDNSAQQRIKPRLESFKGDHPKEAQMITAFVSKWPATYPLLPSK